MTVKCSRTAEIHTIQSNRPTENWLYTYRQIYFCNSRHDCWLCQSCDRVFRVIGCIQPLRSHDWAALERIILLLLLQTRSLSCLMIRLWGYEGISGRAKILAGHSSLDSCNKRMFYDNRAFLGVKHGSTVTVQIQALSSATAHCYTNQK